MAELKPGDIVDVVWYPEQCSWQWNGIGVVQRVSEYWGNNEDGPIYCVRLVHNGEEGGFHAKDLRKLGELEGYDGTNGGS